MALKTTGAGALAALGTAMLLGAANPTAAQAAPATPELPLPTSHLQSTDVGKATSGTITGLGSAVAPIKALRLDPWAKSSADVLNNGLALQPDNGLPTVGTSTVTGPLSGGGGAKDLPVAGSLLGALPG